MFNSNTEQHDLSVALSIKVFVAMTFYCVANVLQQLNCFMKALDLWFG